MVDRVDDDGKIHYNVGGSNATINGFVWLSKIDPETIRYHFCVGERVKLKRAPDKEFTIKGADQAEYHTHHQVAIRVADPVTIDGDIFYVEKRLRTGVRDVGGLTVTVSPNPEQTAAMVEFNRPQGKYLNAIELREIAELLNEIADCL